MKTLWSILTFVHVIGLSLGVGAATVKTFLLLKANRNYSFIPDYLKVAGYITKVIILGLILLTLSGIGWLILGYDFTGLLVVKLILVVILWILGPIIDNVAEPKFRELAPKPGEEASSSFIRAQKQHLILELIATGLFYLIIATWVLV